MITKKKIYKWISKFKPGIKFKFNTEFYIKNNLDNKPDNRVFIVTNNPYYDFDMQSWKVYVNEINPISEKVIIPDIVTIAYQKYNKFDIIIRDKSIDLL